MGNCISAEFIIETGKAILNEYFGKSTIGQITSALSASDHCPANMGVKGLMECQFLKGQKDVWEVLVVVFCLLFITSSILAYLLWRALKTAVIEYKVQYVERI